jgi:hypothetical protein
MEARAVHAVNDGRGADIALDMLIGDFFLRGYPCIGLARSSRCDRFRLTPNYDGSSQAAYKSVTTA